MTQTMTIIPLLFFNLMSLTLFPWMSTAFILKLIHRDSPHSPLFQPNLSDFQRFKKHVEISEARASYFQQWGEVTGEANPHLLQNNSLRLPINYAEPIFTVEIGIGTPVVKRTLIFDTGSGKTWTQCKPCIRCFKQDEPLFDVRKSRSYRKLHRYDRLAKSFMCTPVVCAYHIGYYSRQQSAGIASVEDFTFLTSTGSSRRVRGLVFGCGVSNVGHFPSEISGILGMDKDEVSFVRQLGSLIKYRFSYCLPVITPTTKQYSYVKFGDEAIIRGMNVQRTPFLKANRHDTLYGMNLIDISIGREKLGLRHGTFPDGCYIDSGSSISLLNRGAFSAVKRFLTMYFSKFRNVREYVGEEVPRELLCYTHPAGFRNFPDMTFHFEGADYHVPPGNLFLSASEGKFFCLAMVGSPNTTILGAYQQRNVRVVYDFKEDMLSFAPEDCSRDLASS